MCPYFLAHRGQWVCGEETITRCLIISKTIDRLYSLMQSLEDGTIHKKCKRCICLLRYENRNIKDATLLESASWIGMLFSRQVEWFFAGDSIPLIMSKLAHFGENVQSIKFQ